MRRLGLLMELPEDKTPGYYAQIIKGLAGKISLLDRDKELLILERPEDREPVLEVLRHYRVPSEELELIQIPEQARLRPSFSDYGFTTRSERPFLYADQTAVFRLVEHTRPEARKPEPGMALLQMEEHLIASWSSDGAEEHMAVDSSLTELMDRIAMAYGCQVQWLE